MSFSGRGELNSPRRVVGVETRGDTQQQRSILIGRPTTRVGRNDFSTGRRSRESSSSEPQNDDRRSVAALHRRSTMSTRITNKKDGTKSANPYNLVRNDGGGRNSSGRSIASEAPPPQNIRGGHPGRHPAHHFFPDAAERSTTSAPAKYGAEPAGNYFTEGGGRSTKIVARILQPSHRSGNSEDGAKEHHLQHQHQLRRFPKLTNHPDEDGSIGTEEGTSSVPRIVVPRGLTSSIAEDVSVITDYTGSTRDAPGSPSSASRGADPSPERKRKQNQPRSRFPAVYTIYGEEKSKGSLSQQQPTAKHPSWSSQQQLADPPSKDAQQIGINIKSRQSPQHSSDDAESSGEEETWSSKGLDPDAASYQELSRRSDMSDPPTAGASALDGAGKNKQKTVVGGKLHLRRPDAPAVSSTKNSQSALSAAASARLKKTNATSTVDPNSTSKFPILGSANSPNPEDGQVFRRDRPMVEPGSSSYSSDDSQNLSDRTWHRNTTVHTTRQDPVSSADAVSADEEGPPPQRGPSTTTDDARQRKETADNTTSLGRVLLQQDQQLRVGRSSPDMLLQRENGVLYGKEAPSISPFLRYQPLSRKPSASMTREANILPSKDQQTFHTYPLRTEASQIGTGNASIPSVRKVEDLKPAGWRRFIPDQASRESKESALHEVVDELGPRHSMKGPRGFQHTKVGRDFFQEVLLPKVHDSSLRAKATEILTAEQNGDSRSSYGRQKATAAAATTPGPAESAWYDSPNSSADFREDRFQVEQGESEDTNSLTRASSDTVDLNEFIFPDNSIVEDESSEEQQVPEEAAMWGSMQTQPPAAGNASDMGIQSLFCCGNIEDDNNHSMLHPRAPYPTMPHPTGANVHVLETIQEVDTILSDERTAQGAGSPVSDRIKSALTDPSVSLGVESTRGSPKKHEQEPFPLIFAKDLNAQENAENKVKEAAKNAKDSSSSVWDAAEETFSDAKPWNGRKIEADGKIETESSTDGVTVFFSDVNSYDDEKSTNESSDKKPSTRESTDVHGSVERIDAAPSEDIISTASTKVQGNLGGGTSCCGRMGGGGVMFDTGAFHCGFSGGTTARQATPTGENTDHDLPVSHLSESDTTANANEPRPKWPNTSQTNDTSTNQNEVSDKNRVVEAQHGKVDIIINDDASLGSDKGGSIGSSTAFFDAEEDGSLSIASVASLEAMLSLSPKSSILQMLEDDIFSQQETALYCGPGFLSPRESTRASEVEGTKENPDLESIQRTSDPVSPIRRRPGDEEVEQPSEFASGQSASIPPKQHAEQASASTEANSKQDFDGTAALRRRELVRRRTLRKLYSSFGEKRTQNEENEFSEPARELETTASTVSQQSSKSGVSQSSIDANIRAMMLQSRAIMLQKNVRRMLALNAYVRTAGATIRLQCASRSWLAKRLLVRMKDQHRKNLKATSIQTGLRRFNAVRSFQRVRTSTVLIQTCVRMSQAKRELRLARRSRDAAVHIQAQIRGNLVAKEFQTVRCSAVLIQSHFRGMVDFKSFQVMRISVVSIQKNIRMIQAAEIFFMFKVSVIDIQRTYRRSVAVRKFQMAEYAALRTQTLYRRSIAMRRYRKERNSAIVVQSAWKAYSRHLNFKSLVEVISIIQSIARARSSRRIYTRFLKAVIGIQTQSRVLSASRRYFNSRCAVIKLQSVWRGAIMRASFSQTMAYVRILQGLARIWFARRIANLHWSAVVTIQAYERKRQAQKVLRAAKIVWQIETAFSNSTNPATIPVNVLGSGDNVSAHSNVQPLLDSAIAEEGSVANSTSKTLDIELNSVNDIQTTNTTELEKKLPSGCPPMVVLVTGEGQEPNRADSGETHRADSGETQSLLSVRAIRAKKNAAKSWNPMNPFSRTSESVSIDESLVPTQVYSELSGHSMTMATNDDWSAKDQSHSTRDYSSAYTGESSRRAFLLSLRESCKQILGCVNSEEVVGGGGGASTSGSGSASGEELSSVGEIRQRPRPALKNSIQTSRDLGGIRIAFADTVEEYSDSAELNHPDVGSPKSIRLKAKRVSSGGKVEDSFSTESTETKDSRPVGRKTRGSGTVDRFNCMGGDEARQTSDEGTVDDMALRENETLDSSLNESQRRDGENFDPRHSPLAKRDRGSIGNFLENTLDYMCLSPVSMAGFFPQILPGKKPDAERSKGAARSSRRPTQQQNSPSQYKVHGRTRHRQSQRSVNSSSHPDPSQLPFYDGAPPTQRSIVNNSPRARPKAYRGRPPNEDSRISDRAFVERAIEKSRLPPPSSRNPSKPSRSSGRSAFNNKPFSRSTGQAAPEKRYSRKVTQVSFEERTIHSETPCPKSRQSRGSAAYHRTPIGASQSGNEQETDLCTNDELFTLLANMLLDFFQSKLSSAKNEIVLRSDDETHIGVLLPGQKRDLFIAAIRRRLSNLPDQASSLHALILRCQELGFDREGSSNPILATRNLSNEIVKVDFMANVKETKASGRIAYSLDSSVDCGGQAAEEARVADEKETVDSELTRQQLTAELREATTLMTDSQNPETSLFWRNHVLDLESRLQAVQSEGTKLQAHPEEILENNRKLVSEIQDREQYVPPTFKHTKESSVQNMKQGQSQQTKNRDSVENQSPMVDVISPADLPGGYHFEAEIEGQRFLATVPPCGVQQGETFTCVMRELDSVAIDIPVGYWKDGMTNACRHGCCHVSIWNAVFCPLSKCQQCLSEVVVNARSTHICFASLIVALAQIGQRIQLDFLGRTEHPQSEHPYYSNRTMMCIVILFWLTVNCALIVGYCYKWEHDLEVSFADYSALALINLAMIGFTIFVTQSTRYSLREKFMIREERCYDLEDVVCSSFCLPCVVCQMQRHTANYNEYKAVCCSKTGLPDGVGVHQDHQERSPSFLV